MLVSLNGCDPLAFHEGTKKSPRIRLRGSLVEYRSGECKKPPPRKKKGAKISQFTRQSRLRMLKFVATIDYTSIPHSLFITLTYPDACLFKTPDQRIQDKQLWLRRCEDYLGREVCGLWRVEWVRRDSGLYVGELHPHFHLLLYNVYWIPWRKVREWWSSVLHYHDYIRTDIRRATGAAGAGYYVSKYCAKVPERASLVNDLSVGATGGHYGYVRRPQIPRADETMLYFPTEGMKSLLLDMARSAMPWANIQAGQSFTCFGRHAERAKEILLQMGLDACASAG